MHLIKLSGQPYELYNHLTYSTVSYMVYLFNNSTFYQLFDDFKGCGLQL